jgi:hypothetical protein
MKNFMNTKLSTNQARTQAFKDMRTCQPAFTRLERLVKAASEIKEQIVPL